ncbi:MAG: hypothetical protein NWE89_00070 [Candidatus Bathyarchaeota archaeon]|nr:hypothetical protein [Candidatus Bathyarchaeota archaeon]
MGFSFQDIGFNQPQWTKDDYFPSSIDPYSKPEDLETVTPFTAPKEPTDYRFNNPSRPYIPKNLKNILDKGKILPLEEDEMTILIEGIAKVSIEYYELNLGKFVAISFDGRILESADSQIKLLMKIQGKDFKQDLFLWHVGSDSFLGWEF